MPLSARGSRPCRRSHTGSRPAIGFRRAHRPVNAARRALLLIRRVRPSGEEEPPDDDGQNDDDVGETTGLTAGLPALGRPHPDVAHVPANCLERGGACASESTKTI